MLLFLFSGPPPLVLLLSLALALYLTAVELREQEWHWNAAIGLLDILCDVGAPTRCGPGIRAERLAQLEDTPRSRQDAPGREEKPTVHLLL